MRPRNRRGIHRSKTVIGAVCGFLAASGAVGQAGAPEPCPEFPIAGRGLALLMVIEPDGTLTDCKVDPKTSAAGICDPRPGFVCVFLKADARPTITAISGPLSSRVDQVFVDGKAYADGASGYPHLHLRDVIGTGPSGDTHDLVVHSTVEGAGFATTLTVATGPDRQVAVTALQIEPLD